MESGWKTFEAFSDSKNCFQCPRCSVDGKHLTRFQREIPLFNFFLCSEDSAFKFHVISRKTDFCFIIKVLCGALTSWNQKQVLFSSPFCNTHWEGTSTLLQTFQTCKIFVDLSILHLVLGNTKFICSFFFNTEENFQFLIHVLVQPITVPD